MSEDRARWKRVASMQDGLMTRSQLAEAGVERAQVARRVCTERWQLLSPTVVATFTGELTTTQHHWRAILHAGRGAMLTELTAASAAGLENWSRDTIAVLIPYSSGAVAPLPGVAYRRTRRNLASLRQPNARPPRCRFEPAVLLFASRERNLRTARGILTASVQQRLTTPEALREWIDRLEPLRHARQLRMALDQIEGGAHSVAEMDVTDMCRRYGIALPSRQTQRRDHRHRLRATDCEWTLANGATLVLEVDGRHHLDADQWQADIARQRALSASNRIIIRCTADEIRDAPFEVAHDLKKIGVPLS